MSRTVAKRSAERLRALARALRRLPDRALHPLRRRAARHSLTERGFPRLALIVCHGNICRSPYAAGALRRLLANVGGLQIVSAGFVGPDRPAPPEAVASAAARGVDLSRHRSKVLVPREVQEADLIVVMDATQRRAICRGFVRLWRDVVVLGDLDPTPIETRGIADPLDQPCAVFAQSYARIDRCLRELTRILESGVVRA